jgi:hypothetical protein
MDISNVITVNTVVQDRSASRASFGTIAIFARHTLGPAVRTYDTNPAGLAAMVADGIGTGHDAYIKLSSISSQEVKPPRVKVYRRAAANAQTVTLLPLITAEGYVYDFTVKGPSGVSSTITYTVLAAATATTIGTALAALIDALAGVGAVSVTGTITVTPTVAGDRFFIDTPRNDFTRKDTSADAGIATDLATGQALDPDFYGVLTDGYSEAEINAAAAWCQANGKLFIGLSHDTEVITSASTDVASDMETAAYTRAGVAPSAYQTTQAHAALMGRQLAQSPGSSSWNNRALVANADNFTSTQLGHATGKNATIFGVFGGVGVTHNAKTSGGRLYDTTRDLDWFDANLATDLFLVLVNNEKVPYDARGKALIQAATERRGALATTAGVFEPGTFAVQMPADGADDPADKSVQLLRFTWSAVKSVGIDKIAVSGTVSF